MDGVGCFQLAEIVEHKTKSAKIYIECKTNSTEILWCDFQFGLVWFVIKFTVMAEGIIISMIYGHEKFLPGSVV